MKARVYVTLKKTVLDPQGQSILQALTRIGYPSIKEVRQGKVFEIELNGLSGEAAKQEIERVAKEVLTNPVIEEYRYELEGETTDLW
jgi:phosphoribosylformylglycinamidine synthase